MTCTPHSVRCCTATEANLFSEELYGEPPWIGPMVSPAHVLRASSSLGHTVAEVLDLFDRFEPLGYQVAGRSGYPAQLSPVEHEALRHVETVGYRLTPLHLLMIAGRTGVTARQVHRDLGRLVDGGLLTLPDEGTVPEIVPTEDERTLIGEELYPWDGRLYRNRLATGWLAVRMLAGEIGAPRFGDFEARLARYRRLLDAVDPHRPVTVPEIIDLAYMYDLSIAAAVEVYRQLFPATADLSALPPAALASTATCHRYEER